MSVSPDLQNRHLGRQIRSFDIKIELRLQNQDMQEKGEREERLSKDGVNGNNKHKLLVNCHQFRRL